jgi:hypothetical protein
MDLSFNVEGEPGLEPKIAGSRFHPRIRAMRHGGHRRSGKDRGAEEKNRGSPPRICRVSVIASATGIPFEDGL